MLSEAEAWLSFGFSKQFNTEEKVKRKSLIVNNNLFFILGFRTIRTARKELKNPCRGIVDGDLVFIYTDLSATDKAQTRV